MIELVAVGNRWTWTLICPLGRVLVYTPASWPSDLEAADAAKAYRAAFWALADQIDHRQARAI
ncbi:hypothetical protein vBEliSR6L_56 [Erythrobacter phage vB_EliS_R6L]|nr:hypothetical protein vBEliSR6L_56 [Erythrobacter phage vB_EliS_R6L]